MAGCGKRLGAWHGCRWGVWTTDRARCAGPVGWVASRSDRQRSQHVTDTYATLVTTRGEIRVQLFEDTAPTTVTNFVGLATGSRVWKDPKTGAEQQRPLYDGTRFHRVIPQFMIQGGDPLGSGTGGPGYSFEDEVAGPHRFDRPGRLAMANAGPNTNGSQFFITQAPTPWLDGKHTIFGQVVSGMDVVDAIAATERDGRDRPLQEQRLERVLVEPPSAG